jgi:hypothetical protein
MDKYQVRSALNRTFPIGYNNTTGNIFIDTTGSTNGQVLTSSGGTVIWANTSGGSTTLVVGTTPITSGTAGRILFEGAGNVLQENAILNLDTTNGLIIGGATARATRQTIVNSANTYATKIFVQRNAADSADYTSIRGDGAIDFANIVGSAANNLIYANGVTLVTTFGSAATYNSQFGMGNSYSYTAGALNYNTMVGALNTLQITTGLAETSTTLGFNNTLRNSNYCNIMGSYTRMNGATRCNIIGGRGTSLRDITGTDTTIIGTCTEPNGVGYTGSLVTYFNNAYSSHWFYKNGNIGLFGQKAYQILTDNTGSATNRLSTYMNLTATNTMTIHNGTETGGNIADAIQVYAKDITAGNTAMHIWNENGEIIKLYKTGTYTQTYNTASRTVNAYTPDTESVAYTGIDNLQVGTVYAQVSDLNTLRVAYENLRTSYDNLIQVVTALIDDGQLTGLIA